MAERWKTLKLALEGGLIENEDLLMQSESRPGSGVQLINFEPGLKGGYRRVNGYSQFLTFVGAASIGGPILGIFVFDGKVIVCRGENIRVSEGSDWSLPLNSTDIVGAGRYRAAKYNFASPTIMMVDGSNHPHRYQPDGDGYTSVTAAPTGASCIAEFRQHIFLGVGTSLFFSQPTDDTGWSALLGAGEINVGQDIVNIYPFRDELYIFCKDQIHKLTGDSYLNFQLIPVTKNIGCSAPDSIQEIGGNLIFLGPDGLRPIAATDRNNDVELSSISRAIQQKITNLVDQYGASAVASVVVREKSQYRIWASNSAVLPEDAFGILGGLRRKEDNSVAYEWFEMKGFQMACADSGYIGDEEYVVHGDFYGNVYRQEVGYGIYSGNNPFGLEAVFQTPYLTFGDPTIRKTMYKIDMYVDFEDSQVGSIALNVLYDYNENGVLQPPTITINGTDADFFFDDNAYFDSHGTRFADVAATVVKKNLIGSGRSISFKFSSSDLNPPYTIRSFVVQYNTGGRR